MGANEDAALDAVLAPHILPATRATLTPSSSPPAPTASRFGGDPFLLDGEAWPHCICGLPLSFIAQLDLRGTAAPPLPFHLISFYYCWDCFPQDGPEGPWRLRTYIDPRDSDATRAPSPTPDPRRTDPLLVTFSPIRTLPVWESIDRFSADARACARAANPDAPWEAFNAACERLAGAQELGTVIGGHPHWLQGDETPPDARFLCAFDSAGSITWGDCGLIYLFLTPNGPSLILQSL